MAKYSLNTPYLILTGMLIVVIVASLSLYLPMYNKLQEKKGDTKKTEDTLIERQTFLSQLDIKRAQLAQMQQAEAELTVALPVDDRMEDMTRIIAKAGDSAGVIIKSVSNTSDSVQSVAKALRLRGDSTSMPDTVTPLGMAMDVAGTYPQLHAFLETLEKSPRFLEIRTLDMQHTPTDGEQITARLQTRFYKQAPSL